jgi:anti-sigma factor RsiW
MGSREETQWLLNYCAGKLEAETAARLEGHMAACGACREFVRGQRAVWEALDGWQAPTVSSGFDRRLYERIEAQVGWWDLLVRRWQSPLGPGVRWRTVAATAAAGLMLTAGILLQQAATAPVPVPHDVAQADTVQPEQVERTLDAMEMLNEFSHHVGAEAPAPNSKL